MCSYTGAAAVTFWLYELVRLRHEPQRKAIRSTRLREYALGHGRPTVRAGKVRAVDDSERELMDSRPCVGAGVRGFVDGVSASPRLVLRL
mmetsp:Transcript_114835/g.329794  ORF Transcript_114835/g.329794 Transcript_114835/m.329794 type:complete len:90 (-) Transcript_114835:76-345(-)